MEDKTEKIPVYLYRECVADLPKAVDFSEQMKCNVLITSITNPNFRREFTKQSVRDNHLRFTRSELLLEPAKWQTQVVAKLSDSIDCDSSDENIRKNSESTLKQEIAFAQHVAGHGSVLVKINGTNTSNLARILSSELTGSFLKLLLFSDKFDLDFRFFFSKPVCCSLKCQWLITRINGIIREMMNSKNVTHGIGGIHFARIPISIRDFSWH